jgi:hypothetical protein
LATNLFACRVADSLTADRRCEELTQPDCMDNAARLTTFDIRGWHLRSRERQREIPSKRLPSSGRATWRLGLD